jgi:hypothetical protein
VIKRILTFVLFCVALYIGFQQDLPDYNWWQLVITNMTTCTLAFIIGWMSNNE